MTNPSKWANDECSLRDWGDYEEYCYTHAQDASLCHFLPYRVKVEGDSEVIKVRTRNVSMRLAPAPYEVLGD